MGPAELIRGLKDGESCGQIAEEWGLSKQAVSRIAQEYQRSNRTVLPMDEFDRPAGTIAKYTDKEGNVIGAVYRRGDIGVRDPSLGVPWPESPAQAQPPPPPKKTLSKLGPGKLAL